MHVAGMSRAELLEYDMILNDHSNEWDMYAWTVGQKPLPEYLQSSGVMKKLMEFTRNKGKDMKSQMPPLHGGAK
jgi:succinate dehydrogenase assembly factor 2